MKEIDKNLYQMKDEIRNEIIFLEVLGFGVPEEIEKYYQQQDYRTAQQLIKKFFESIIEKPLESNKLFK